MAVHFFGGMSWSQTLLISLYTAINLILILATRNLNIQYYMLHYPTEYKIKSIKTRCAINNLLIP